MSGGPLVACDLDRTLIYSAAALGLTGPDAAAPRLEVAEISDGQPLSYCTRRAGRLIEELARAATLVPVTTRTLAQFQRVRLTEEPARYAVIANGGQILIDGRPDPTWGRSIGDRVRRECAPLESVRDHVRDTGDPAWLLRLRDADGLFCYAIVERSRLPGDQLAELTAWCAAHRWTVSMQGRKLYFVPGPITKWAATAEIAERLDLGSVVAAGDSLLDQEMLARADAGIRPAHGELHERGWRTDSVTVTGSAGVLAGEQIAEHLLRLVRRSPAGIHEQY
ncbi:HAD family hydrolase [Actinoplanes awajinensis]|uniref:HAD family hydrolase n=1 Tax=Actinoplanes awajinensis subsp. mycoplanecinus TaxID=135947 RepID=A0A117MPG4_9ACTN|nr:HAD family hydrolase [Actinoplanes awajinensis]KUL28526.1 HAD family hydrolase [Actinoplanes awajinensis subsp. mycoplanecinus]